MAKNWKHVRASARIDKRLKEVADPEIVDYTRDMSLENIPKNKAYRTDGAHLYVDILNVNDMLNCTDVEGETCHKRTLRFLNQHYRAVHRILKECEVKRVDFANQRLHAVVLKPYNTDEGAEAMRVHTGVAVAQMIIDVLAETGDTDEKIPDAKVRVGIDTGMALAVNNGRRGGREPLFLGRPANKAAKRAAGGKAAGIYLTNEARAAIGLKTLADADIDKTPLTQAEIETSQDKAKLPVTKDSIVKQWKDDMKANPIGAFEFSRHTPPLGSLDIQSLTPGNSRRQEAVSIYADLDGFTSYVDKHIENNPGDVVKALHVIRSEMDAVISSDFEGRKIRFIGDCEHALTVDGTAHTTDEEETVSTAVLCAGGVRSSFDLSLDKLKKDGVDTDGLGIAIGFEYGPMTVTRLGMQGDRVRCSISRGVLASEDEQRRCDGRETAIGPEAYDIGTEAVRNLFGKTRKVRDLDYDTAVENLEQDGDKTAKKALREAQQVFAPAVAKADEQPFRPHSRTLATDDDEEPKAK
jgi:class 3 adenylate cyclase